MSEIAIPENLIHETGYKTVNAIPHFYRTIGRGEPFLFLHGGPGMWHDDLVLIDPAPVNVELLMASCENLVGRFSPEEWEYLQVIWSRENGV